jgi:hypothetical protein
MGLYEIQVLDCYDNPTYADGTTGAIYGQYPPLVNACRKPGEWQTYDIICSPPPRSTVTTLVSPAYVTVLLNGVLCTIIKRSWAPPATATLTSMTRHAPPPAR